MKELKIESTSGAFADESNVYEVCQCCDNRDLVAHFTGRDHRRDAEVFVEAREQRARPASR